MSLDSNASIDAGDPDGLLVLVGRGDRSAFALFYDRTICRTLGLITSILKDPAQSEEVAQEVYLEVWRQATRFDGVEGRAMTFTLTTARRRAIARIQATRSSTSPS